MSSWIWMKGVDVAIADPIDPVVPEDGRPAVKDLILEHREQIVKIKAELGTDPLYNASKHDDLWILRYWLSHKNTKDALAAAAHTLKFRQDFDLDTKDIRDIPPRRLREGPVADYWQKRWRGDALVCVVPDKHRGAMMFIDFTGSDPSASKMKEEIWLESYVYCSEWTHQWLDYITRTTGRFTKSIRFIDFSGVSLTKHIDRVSNIRDSKIMNYMEDCYPQLLATMFICGTPSWIHLLWAVFRPLLPQRLIDKIDVVHPERNEKERARILKHISMEDLPLKYGGENQVAPKDWTGIEL